jgi:molybdenum cofactor guanylyltransferase
MISNPKSYSDACALLLSGGKSSRMGQDKARIVLEKIELLKQHSLDLKNTFNSGFVISNYKDHRGLSALPLIYDETPFQGPLSAIATGLKHCDSEWVFVFPVDIPKIDFSWVQQLWDAKDDRQVCLFENKENILEPLFALYHKSVLGTFEDALKKQNLSLHKAIKKTKYKVIKLEKHNRIININTPEDLLKFQQKPSTQ